MQVPTDFVCWSCVLTILAPVSVAPLTEEERASVWDEISDDLSSLLQGNGQLPNDVMPFDAASPEDIEQQRLVLVLIFVHCVCC